MISDKKKEQLKNLHSLPRTKEWREKMSLSQKRIGNKPPIGSHKGHLHSLESKKKMSEARMGMVFTKETRRRMSIAKSKENHPAWRGGVSNNPYPKEFNNLLKLNIRKRDNFICCLCGRTEREELEELNRVLCVNHIDFNKNNCTEENLNTLCLRCNLMVNWDREKWIKYFINNK